MSDPPNHLGSISYHSKPLDSRDSLFPKPETGHELFLPFFTANWLYLTSYICVNDLAGKSRLFLKFDHELEKTIEILLCLPKHRTFLWLSAKLANFKNFIFKRSHLANYENLSMSTKNPFLKLYFSNQKGSIKFQFVVIILLLKCWLPS